MFGSFYSDEFISNLVGYVEIMKDLNRMSENKTSSESNSPNKDDVIEGVDFRVVEDEQVLLSDPSMNK